MTLRRLVLALSLALVAAVPAYAQKGSAGRTPAEEARGSTLSQPLVDALNARDPGRIEGLIDMDALVARALEDIDHSPRVRDEIREGAMQASRQLATNLAGMLRQSSVQVRLLRERPLPAGDGTEVLMRYDLHDAAGEFAGVDYVLAEVAPDGRMRDWYSHAHADSASGTMRRLFLLMLGAEPGAGGGDDTLVARLLGLPTVDEALVRDFSRLTELRAKGDLPGALAVLEGLQGPVRETRMWAVLRVQLTPPTDEARHAANLAALHRGWGDDPDLQLLLVDHYFNEGDFAALVRALESFERAVVEDDFTARMKCFGGVQGQLWDGALRDCARAVELAPDDANARILQLAALSGARDLQGVIDAIEAFEARTGDTIDAAGLARDPAFAWLQDERAFRRWVASRGKRR
jgi:hypothetical protein